MAYFLGKGAVQPVAYSPYQDQEAEAAAATQSGDCRNECYERYNLMLSDANVSDASAMSFLNRCLGECASQPQVAPQAAPPADASAIVSPYAKPQVQPQGQADVQAGDTPVLPPEIRPQPPIRDSFCPGGYPLKEGIFVPGAPGHTGCQEGYVPKHNPADNWTYCCKESPEDARRPEDGETQEGCIPITTDFKGGAGQGVPWWNDPHGIIPAKTVKRSVSWQGHMVWHEADQKFYDVSDLHDFYEGKTTSMPKGWNKACPKGYKKKGQLCCPDADAGDGDAAALGEFKWPAELYDLYNRLMGRAGEFLDRPPGFSPEFMNTWFGKDYDRIRGTERIGREEGLRQLQTEGLIGTGASQDFASDLAWGTEKAVADLTREIFLANEQQKRSDLLDFTGAAGNIFGQGQQFVGGEEAINAGRRMESMQAIAQFMQYIISLMQSWGA